MLISRNDEHHISFLIPVLVEVSCLLARGEPVRLCAPADSHSDFRAAVLAGGRGRVGKLRNSSETRKGLCHTPFQY